MEPMGRRRNGRPGWSGREPKGEIPAMAGGTSNRDDTGGAERNIRGISAAKHRSGGTFDPDIADEHRIASESGDSDRPEHRSLWPRPCRIRNSVGSAGTPAGVPAWGQGFAMGS